MPSRKCCHNFKTKVWHRSVVCNSTNNKCVYIVHSKSQSKWDTLEAFRREDLHVVQSGKLKNRWDGLISRNHFTRPWNRYYLEGHPSGTKKWRASSHCFIQAIMLTVKSGGALNSSFTASNSHFWQLSKRNYQKCLSGWPSAVIRKMRCFSFIKCYHVSHIASTIPQSTPKPIPTLSSETKLDNYFRSCAQFQS